MIAYVRAWLAQPAPRWLVALTWTIGALDVLVLVVTQTSKLRIGG